MPRELEKEKKKANYAKEYYEKNKEKARLYGKMYYWRNKYNDYVGVKKIKKIQKKNNNIVKTEPIYNKEGPIILTFD